MNTFKATLRIEKATARISLFFYDEHADLNAFNFYEGHCSASYNYYLNDTLPAHIDAAPEDYAGAFKAYNEQYFKYAPFKLEIVKRISRNDNKF